MPGSAIHGVVPVLPTPFHASESVNEGDYENMLAFAKAAGCAAVQLPAFGSEFYKLSGDERSKILDVVFKQANGLNVIVQCNHASPKVVRSLIADAEERGAAAINTALPRAMPVSESDLLNYARIVCSSTQLPVILQDYNPGGAIVGLHFVKKLSDECENFQFVKYEVAGIGPLIKDILNATHEKVKVFSGWGGSYLLEQFPCGIAGIMPGISLADYFSKIWEHLLCGHVQGAMKMFTAISPYLSFSLQHLELFHHAEKRLAVRRGILTSAQVRSVSIALDEYQEKYLELLLDQTCEAIEQHSLKIKMD